MNPKWIYAIFGIMLLGGVVFAISGATLGTEYERGRWSNLSASSVVTEGGNITGVDVSSSSLTDRWASFYGNVTGSIVLRDAGNLGNVYNWSWSPSGGGEVCVSTNSGFGWASSTAVSAVAMNTQWGFGSAPDNATETYTGSGCALTFSSPAATVASTIYADLMGSSTYWSCAIADTGSPAGKGNFAFCANINSSGTNWAGEGADYEIMVPTDDSTATATETYYFFLELG